MKALLIIAHGSRRAASNDEVRELTARIRGLAGERFGQVDCAFLELAEPSIPDGIECCVRNGAEEVVVLPYFLSAGRHVISDIPEEVEGKQQQYPDVNIHIVPYLGSADSIPELMLQLAS